MSDLVDAVHKADNEYIPTEAIFLLAHTITRRGSLRTAEAARMINYDYNSVERVFSKASRTVPLYKPERGQWAVCDETAERLLKVAHIVRKLRSEHMPPPGAHYLMALPVKARDLGEILDVLEMLIRPLSAATVEADE
jgi:hypothetical protein